MVPGVNDQSIRDGAFVATATVVSRQSIVHVTERWNLVAFEHQFSEQRPRLVGIAERLRHYDGTRDLLFEAHLGEDVVCQVL